MMGGMMGDEFAIVELPKMTRPMIEAAYLQWRNSNMLYFPLLSGLLSIEDWRDRELAKLES